MYPSAELAVQKIKFERQPTLRELTVGLKQNATLFSGLSGTFISFRNFSIEVAANTYSIELNPSSIINKSAQDEARLVTFKGLLTPEKTA